MRALKTPPSGKERAERAPQRDEDDVLRLVVRSAVARLGGATLSLSQGGRSNVKLCVKTTFLTELSSSC